MWDFENVPRRLPEMLFVRKYFQLHNFHFLMNGRKTLHGRQRPVVRNYAAGILSNDGQAQPVNERICWFVMLVFSVCGASYLIYQAYRTMKENPIIESTSLTRASIWEVPLPSVTICAYSHTKLSHSELNRSKWPKFERNLLAVNFTDVNMYELYGSVSILETLLLRSGDQNNYDILKKVLPEIKNITKGLVSISGIVDVFLQKTITPLGPCVTLNMYQEKDILRDGVILSSLHDTVNSEQLWNRESGFKNHLSLDNYTYPLRSFHRDDAFVFTFQIDDSKKFVWFTGDYKIVLHPPDEIPVFGRHSEYIWAIPGEHYYIRINPRLVVSEGIEHYPPEVRQCYYSNERYLKFYKNYTQSHCEWECQANYTMTQCDCIPYHFPHFGDAKLCTMKSQFECVTNKEDEFFRPNLNDNGGRTPVDDCKCLPSCTQLRYNPELTPKTGDRDYMYVGIRNKYPHLEKHVRTELHSISEFLSNCGGALGLFLGVSIFSVMELFYFCTIRFYSHSKERSVSSSE